MKKNLRILMGGAHILALFCLFLLIYISLGYVNPGPKTDRVKRISSVTVAIGDQDLVPMNLPCSFWDLPPRTPVTIRTTIYPEPDEEVFVESKYCPGKVFLDGVLGYEFGHEGQFPSFMIDPTTEVHMIETRGSFRAMELTIEFLSPATQRRMVVEPPLLGNTKEIMLERFHAYGVPCVLAAAQIIYGVALLLVAICVQFIDKKGVSFMWLGLLALVTGFWSLGENNFSGVIFKNSTLLYVFSFGGFFTFIIPLLRFARSLVNYENPKPIWYLELFMAIAAGIALLLQLMGILSCTTSMHFFYLVLPPSQVFLTVYTVREWIKYRKASALRFILPIGILSASSVLGLFGYFYSITYTVSSLTQLGMISFLLLVGISTSFSLKDSIALQNQQRELNFERSMMEIQARQQKKNSELLTQQAELLSHQRHDLRHHLNVIQALASEENAELQDYLNTLMDGIPIAGKQYCENQAVNAIVAHYVTLCQKKNIELTLDLTVPEGNPHVSDSSLCVIFGNLLENAVEACDRLKDEKRFIRLQAKLQYEMMVIAMDNSFNGVIGKDGRHFQSSKREGLGIGLSSISSAAQKAGGNADFHADGMVFLSSVYLSL